MLHRGILPIRIGVDLNVAPHRWSELRVLSSMTPEIATGLASVGKDRGANPGRWRGTFEAVSTEQWKAVEFFNGRGWEPLDYQKPAYLSAEAMTAPLNSLM